MTVREANKNDARRISYLIHKNTDNVAENKYSKKQIEVWKAENTPVAIKNKSKQLSQRTGELWVKQVGERVEIKGKAITVFEAKLKMENNR